MADLWWQLGEVPLNRILLSPPLGTANERDVIARLEASETRLCELVDGVLVEKPTGQFESRLAALIIHFLYNFLDQHDLGIVLAPDGPLRLSEALVRLPDVSFVSWNRLPGRAVTQEAILASAPDLAIEILGKGNTPREMERKLREYFDAGVTLVWYIDPASRSAVSYAAIDKPVPHDQDTPLDASPVLPGFQLSLKTLFARAGSPSDE
jgi:Uma2 family endonuclease